MDLDALLALWAQDIDSVPFAHELSWSSFDAVGERMKETQP